jgi:hypothetical protein
MPSRERPPELIRCRRIYFHQVGKRRRQDADAVLTPYHSGRLRLARQSRRSQARVLRHGMPLKSASSEGASDVLPLITKSQSVDIRSTALPAVGWLTSLAPARLAAHAPYLHTTPRSPHIPTGKHTLPNQLPPTPEPRPSCSIQVRHGVCSRPHPPAPRAQVHHHRCHGGNALRACEATRLRARAAVISPPPEGYRLSYASEVAHALAG